MRVCECVRERKCVLVCVCECVSVRVWACVSVCMCECLRVWVCECVWVHSTASVLCLSGRASALVPAGSLRQGCLYCAAPVAKGSTRRHTEQLISIYQQKKPAPCRAPN